MSARTATLIAAIVMLPALAAAQHVPEPPNVLRPNRQDLFRAGADTYTPKPPDDLGLFFPQSAAVWPVWGPAYYPEVYRRAGEVRPEPQTVRIVVEHVLPPPAPATPVAPATTMPSVIPPQPGHTRTLYVIPGCYAGDKLPRADQLRAGCSLRNVRTISPVL
jgi:hypothetical protein